MKSQQNIIEQVFVSMRFGRKYSPGFIASRQGLNVSTVRACLARLVGGGRSHCSAITVRQTAQALHIQTAIPATVGES